MPCIGQHLLVAYLRSERGYSGCVRPTHDVGAALIWRGTRDCVVLA